MKLLLSTIALLSWLAGPSLASAGDVVLVPTSGGLGGELPDIAARITEAIKRVAIKKGLSPKVTTASRDDVFAVAGCNSDDDPCHQAVLRTLAAEKLILLHVTPSATATAEVEIVVAASGKPTVRVVLSLNGKTAAALIAELEAKAGSAFAEAPSQPTPEPTPPDPDVEVPIENRTIDGGLATGEGAPFSGPTGGEDERPISPYDEPPPTDQQLAGPTEPAPEPEDRGGGYDFSRVGGTAWAVTGAGAGLFATSILFYSLASGKQGEVNRARVNTAADIERLRDLESSGKTLTNIGNTAFLLGLVGLGVGGYLIYRDAKVPLGEASTVSIAPQMIGDGFGIGLAVTR